MKLTAEQKEANKLARKQQRAIDKYIASVEAQKNQREVKSLTITIEWKKSRTWGNCPRAYAEISYKDGGFERTDAKYYASGYGYDKESTVIAEIFNEFLKYKLWEKSIEELRRNDHSWKNEGGAPYGVRGGSYESDETKTLKEFRTYEGGIGANCYFDICEFIGGKFERMASGRTFDVYKYTYNEA